jgi:hypothetical protein
MMSNYQRVMCRADPINREIWRGTHTIMCAYDWDSKRTYVSLYHIENVHGFAWLCAEREWRVDWSKEWDYYAWKFVVQLFRCICLLSGVSWYRDQMVDHFGQCKVCNTWKSMKILLRLIQNVTVRALWVLGIALWCLWCLEASGTHDMHASVSVRHLKGRRLHLLPRFFASFLYPFSLSPKRGTRHERRNMWMASGHTDTVNHSN